MAKRKSTTDEHRIGRFHYRSVTYFQYNTQYVFTGKNTAKNIERRLMKNTDMGEHVIYRYNNLNQNEAGKNYTSIFHIKDTTVEFNIHDCTNTKNCVVTSSRLSIYHINPKKRNEALRELEKAFD